MTTWKERYHKIIESTKKGFKDIMAVLEERNYKLFLKQLAFLVAVFLLCRYVSKTLQTRDAEVLNKIKAVQAQKNNEQEYLSNKKKLLGLEPRFPDIEAKNDWLLRQIVAVFKDSPLVPKVGSSQTENTSNNGYTVVQIPVELTTSYGDFARLLASVESRDEYLRVTEFSLDKKKEDLGQNTIKMNIQTIFPKEKIAKSIFKNTDLGDKKNQGGQK